MDSVSICNMALMMLGMNRITNFDEENNNAKLCKQFFPILRDRVLRDHTWSFATAAADLQRVADEDSFDPAFPVVCGLPPDVIRVVQLVGDIPYRCVGRKIFVADYPAKVIYIRRVEDASEFDVTFTEALQYLLAAEIGMANTLNTNLINYYRREYEQRLRVARSIDSAENVHAHQSGSRSSWIAARW